jgi:hypothetical protein
MGAKNSCLLPLSWGYGLGKSVHTYNGSVVVVGDYFGLSTLYQ